MEGAENVKLVSICDVAVYDIWHMYVFVQSVICPIQWHCTMNSSITHYPLLLFVVGCTYLLLLWLAFPLVK